MSIDTYQKPEFLDLMSKTWQRFFKQFNEIDTIPVWEWKPKHLVAYFAGKYSTHYENNFAFSMNVCPSKCSEVYLMKRIMGMVGTSNQTTIKEYIDWIFNKKIQGKKIRSIGFLANAQFCNEFKLWKKESEKIDRATKIPDHYKQAIAELNIPIETFGDLAFAKLALDAHPNSDATQSYASMFKKLYLVGFEINMIKGLK